jgi:hypothetical protein
VGSLAVYGEEDVTFSLYRSPFSLPHGYRGKVVHARQHSTEGHCVVRSDGANTVGCNYVKIFGQSGVPKFFSGLQPTV